MSLICLLLASGCKKTSFTRDAATGIMTDGAGLTIAPTVSHDPQYQLNAQQLNKLSVKLNKNVKDMDLEQAAQAKRYALACQDKELALTFVERQLSLEKDHAKQATLRLERADLHFEIGKFEKAGRLYREYNELYPRSECRDTVLYKEILCRFYETLEPDRDQTRTRETLALVSEYLSLPTLYVHYVKDVQEIKNRCTKKLFEHECSVLNCYVMKGSYDAAHKRLAYIKEHFATMPGCQEDLFALECKILSMQGKDAELAAVKRQYAQAHRNDRTHVPSSRVYYAARF